MLSFSALATVFVYVGSMTGCTCMLGVLPLGGVKLTCLVAITVTALSKVLNMFEVRGNEECLVLYVVYVSDPLSFP